MLCPVCARNLPVPLECCPYCGLVLRASLDEPIAPRLPEDAGRTAEPVAGSAGGNAAGKRQDTPFSGTAADGTDAELAALVRDFGRIRAMQADLLREMAAFESRLSGLTGAEITRMAAADGKPESCPEAAEAGDFVFASDQSDKPWESASGTETPDAGFVFSETPSAGTDSRSESFRSARRSFRMEGGGFDEAAFGRKWLLILGVIVMVLGVGYFLKYSFEQDWVGPWGRVGSVAAWGAAFLGVGESLRRRGLGRFSAYLSGGGLAVLYFAGYAGFGLYEIFTQPVTLTALVGVTLLAAWLALRDDAPPIAGLALVGGLLAPVLVRLHHGEPHGLMLYLIALNLGVLAVSWRKRWEFPGWLALTGTSVLFWNWFAADYVARMFTPVMIYLNILHLEFLLLPLLLGLSGPRDPKSQAHLLPPLASFLAFVTGYGVISGLYDEHWSGLLTLGFAVAHTLLAVAQWRSKRDDVEALTGYAGSALCFLALTPPLALDGFLVSMIWSAQAAVLVWMGARTGRHGLYKGGLALLALAGLHLFARDYPDAFDFSYLSMRFESGWPHKVWMRLADVLLFLMALAGSWWSVRRRLLDDPDDGWDGRGAGRMRLLAGWFLAVSFVLLTAETTGLFRDYLAEAGGAAVSAAWGLYAVVLMTCGFRRSVPALRKTALAVLVAAIVKIFFFDTVGLGTVWRVVSFVGLGLILMAASYLYHRFRDRIGGSGS